MTTIYLTQYQYQMVLDGQISTHLDVLDNNNDGKLTQLGDGEIAVEHRQTQSIACGSPRHYVYGTTELADTDDDAYTDIQLIGLSHENDQALGYSSSEIDFGGELYGYCLETLNKVIDYYNNGGSWNDDDFEEHVYDGIGATGELAPESVTGTANADGQMDNPIQNDQLLWNCDTCNSLEDILSLNGIDSSEVASHTTDSQGRISTITLTSGRTLWANYDLSDEGVTASFLSELQAAGATDIKYDSNGMIAGYTINGTTYNVSSDYGETSTDDTRTQELLAQVDSIKAQVSTATTEKTELEAEKTELEQEEEEQEEKVSAAKLFFDNEQEKLEEEQEEQVEVQQELKSVNNKIEAEANNSENAKTGSAKNSTLNSLISLASDLASSLSSIKKNVNIQTSSVDSAKDTVTAETNTLNDIGVQIADVNSNIFAKDAEIANLEAQLTEKEAELNQ